MTRRVLLGSTLLVLLLSCHAFSQAAAESAIVNSTTGTAAAKTGSALGNALGNAMDKSAQRLSTATQSPTQPTPTPNPMPAAAPNDTAAPQPVAQQDAAIVQFSVQDVGTNCPAPKDWKQDDTKAPATNNLTVCSLHASSKPFPKTKYKPVVDIKF
jgi:hypothetical protein